MSNKVDRLGERFVLKSGKTVEVVQYNSSSSCIVANINDLSEKVECEVCQLKRGTLKMPFDILVAGVGYLGLGPYKPRPKGEQKSLSYVAWSNMLTRVYRGYTQQTAYLGASVSEDWWNFQTFSKWFYSQEGFDKGWHLDKDILGGKQKHYSEDYCVLVPKILNSFAVGIYSGNGYPSGIHRNTDNKFVAQMSNSLTKKRESLGNFEDPTSAFYAYKMRKENHLKEVLYSEYCENLSEGLKNKLLSGFEVVL